MTRTIIWTALVSAVLATTGCKRDRDDGTKAITAPTAQEQREAEAQRDVDRAKDNLAEARADLRRATEERIARLDARIDELERKGDAKSKELAADFRARRDAARAKLDEAEGRTESNWEQFKSDVSAGWDQLEKDVSNAIDEID